jgi:hypothetical protein
VEDSAYSVEKMDIENNLGFEEPDVNPKVNGRAYV